jgi:spore maturation protein SpmB
MQMPSLLPGLAPVLLARTMVAEAVCVCLHLFKIMIPIIVGVKILQEFDLIRYLALPLTPMMEAVGLPPSMGLVWATAMISNLYGAMVVFVNLPAAESMSAAQVTVLATMMLVAHNLPVELRIAQESGTRFPFQLAVRIGGAFLLGLLLHLAYTRWGWLTQTAQISWHPAPKAAGLHFWAFEQVKALFWIFLIVLALIVLMRALAWLRITEMLVRLLEPVLRLIGVGREAAPITIIGMTMGLAYGGGLIIREAKTGKVRPKDVFFSLTLMGLAHSVVEDTLLMLVLGAHLSGLLWARIAFALCFILILVRIVRQLPHRAVHRFLFRQEPAEASS